MNNIKFTHFKNEIGIQFLPPTQEGDAEEIALIRQMTEVNLTEVKFEVADVSIQKSFILN